jgi:hypothetical protein
MNVRTIPRVAVEGSLRLVRLPLDAAIALLPGNGTGAQPKASLALDRADARVRAVVAAILGDPVLNADARRRREAVAERERAVDLRDQAKATTEQAESRLEERHEQAERQRSSAAQRASAKQKDAERERAAKADRAKATERARVANSEKAEARVDEAIDEQAPRERLQVLDARSKALGDKEKALTARDEARRLRDAASRAKAERKNS